jgi:hypothetical protein
MDLWQSYYLSRNAKVPIVERGGNWQPLLTSRRLAQVDTVTLTEHGRRYKLEPIPV